MTSQAFYLYELAGMWAACEEARARAAAERAAQIAVAQKAVERANCEAANGRLLVSQFRAAVSAVEAALEGEA